MKKKSTTNKEIIMQPVLMPAMPGMIGMEGLSSNVMWVPVKKTVSKKSASKKTAPKKVASKSTASKKIISRKSKKGKK